MERSYRNFLPSSSKRKFQATCASPNRYFTENSRWVPLILYLPCVCQEPLSPIRACLGLFILEYLVISYLMEPRENNQHNYFASICRKKTFTGLYTKWDSFTSRKYRINFICKLAFRCYRICLWCLLLQSSLKSLSCWNAFICIPACFVFQRPCLI